MLVLLFLLSTWSDVCHSQIVYMPRYVVRPVRRSAMEALERLRLPVNRYFPQVDTQAAPYQGPPVLAGYQMGDAYNVPPQWMEDYAQPPQEEETDYGNYEYDFNPVYRSGQYGEEVYAQEPVEEPNVYSPNAYSPNAYNDLMDRYLMEEPKEDMFDIQRRGGHIENESQTANINATTTTTTAPSSTPQVQVTAVPSAPEKKDVKSLVVPDQIEERDEEAGQKEEPLFRPLQSSQRTMWNGLRVKNTHEKNIAPELNLM